MNEIPVGSGQWAVGMYRADAGREALFGKKKLTMAFILYFKAQNESPTKMY